MAEEKPFVPPFRKPVSEFKTPDQTIIFVTELVNRDDPAYTANAPVKRGTLYKDIVGGDPRLSVTHPLLYFCGERKFQLSDQYVIWDWSSDEMAHSSYNADITYELEAAGFPVYTRTYTIRRDDYEQNPTIAIGSPLEALIGVTILNGGEDYTFATGEIEGKNATVEFVVSSGVIISGVVTNEGTGVLSTDVITITGDGALAEIIPMVQPTSAVLTSQKKEELPDDNPWANEFVKVTRVYQMLPGPTIHSTQLHVDGVVVDVATTLKVASTIVSGETLVGTTWTITTKTQDDNQYTGKEIVITRTVPGNPVPYTKVEDDGKVTTGTRTLKDTTLITTAETLVGTTWTHKYKEFLTTRLTIGEEASDLVSWEVVESRPIPGNPVPSTRLDDDGIKVDVVTTLKDTTAITSSETFGTGVWTRTHKESVSDLVAKEIVETRAIPGANIVEETIDDRDGAVQVVVRSMVDNATFIAINPKEYIDSGFYIKVESKAVSGSSLVVWQSITTRIVPGNDVVKTVIDANDDVMTETRTIVEGPPTLVTSSSIIANVWTKTFGEPINDLISWKVVQVRETQNVLDSFELTIPDLIPEEFRATIPVLEAGETLIGTVPVLTTLPTGYLMLRVVQLDDYTYRASSRFRDVGDLPQIVINKEITSEFGGGEVNRTATLDLYDNLTLDEGLTVLTSEIRKLDSQANGLAVKTTRELNDSAWPILPSRLWDDNLRIEYDETKQTIDTGTAEDPNPGVFAWVSEIRAYDKWKANKTNTSKGAPQYVDEASALISYEFKPFKFPGLLTLALAGYYVRSSFAELIQHKLRTWWLSSSTTPTVGIPGSGSDVEIEEIIPDNVIISTLNDVTVLAYSGMVLHDDLTTFGVLFWPATTPSYTTYIGSWQGNEKVIAGTVTPEKEKDVWKIVTESVIMR